MGPCGGDRFIDASATLTGDARCARCATACPAGETLGTACSIGHDTRCEPEPSSTAGTARVATIAAVSVGAVATMVFVSVLVMRRRSLGVGAARRSLGGVEAEWDLFTSHTQRSGRATTTAGDLSADLEKAGFRCSSAAGSTSRWRTGPRPE